MRGFDFNLITVNYHRVNSSISAPIRVYSIIFVLPKETVQYEKDNLVSDHDRSNYHQCSVAFL